MKRGALLSFELLQAAGFGQFDERGEGGLVPAPGRRGLAPQRVLHVRRSPLGTGGRQQRIQRAFAAIAHRAFMQDGIG